MGRAYPVMSDQSRNVKYAEIILTEMVHFPPGFSITNSSSTQDLVLIELQRPSQYRPITILPANVPLAMLKKNPRLRSMGWAPTGKIGYCLIYLLALREMLIVEEELFQL